MKIEVKNTKLLFLYRIFLFKNLLFKTRKSELKTIVVALNMKKRKERIEYVYDEAIKYINAYYSDDLCKFENNQCIAQRNDGNGNISGCCRLCSLVTDKGCSSCNLACKLIYCKTALGNLKKLKLRDIPILRCFSIFQLMVLRSSFFNTREEILKDLNYGLVYSLFRNIKKEIQLHLYIIKKGL